MRNKFIIHTAQCKLNPCCILYVTGMHTSKSLHCYSTINFKSFHEKTRFIIEVFILKMVHMYNLKIEAEEKSNIHIKSIMGF